MGRTSKFTFPVPLGRKKQATDPALAPAEAPGMSMSKAQKILGSSHLNVDSPQPWDSVSNSGMSVSISESTESAQRSERTAGERSRQGGHNWEEESDTLPAETKTGTANMRPNSSRKGSSAPARDTEASSLGQRRTSSSTIRSWYDKSRVPLSISQQTSASAMAKGLPPKASTILDMDGSRSNPSPKKRGIVPKLDISTLLPRRPSSSSGGPGGGRATTILGHDFVIKSPSLASITTHISPTGLWAEHRSGWRSTRELLHDIVERTTHRRPEAEEIIAPQTGNDVVNLHNLYDHYEQMSFRTVLESEPGEKEQPGQRERQHQHSVLEPVSESSCFSSQSFQQPTILEPAEDEEDIFDPDKPITPGRPIMSPDAECSNSVSSRHTRTSKASKRTNHSMFESDLQQTSVLSLSSDSEDDSGSVDMPKISISAPGSKRGSSGDEMLSPDVEHRRPNSARSARTARSGSKPAKHASFAPVNTYLTIPNEPTPPRQPPNLNPRTSSLTQTPQGATIHIPIPTKTSRLSVMSTSTVNSTTSWQSRPGYGVQEARAVPILPPQIVHHTSTTPERKNRRIPPPILSTKSSSIHSADQPTPPISPTSVDFTIRPTAYTDPAQSSRFMAVTKQEEMLLAALRLKRAKMRESLLSELAEEVYKAEPLPRHATSLATLRESSAYEAPVRAMKRHNSKGSMDSSRRPSYREGAGSVVSLPTRTRSPAASAAHSEPFGTRRSRKYGSRLRDEATIGDAKKERIMLYLQHPAEPTVGRHVEVDEEENEEAEPSPDLSDFMLDDEDSEEVSEDFVLSPHTPDGGERRSTSSKLSESTTGEGRADSPPLSPRSPVQTGEDMNVRVVGEEEGEEEQGGSGADSPVESPAVGEAKGRKGVRLSAVGRVGMEAGLWGDDG